MSILKVVFGAVKRVLGFQPSDDDGSVWGHWQNLTKDDRKGDIPWNGRAWLNFGDKSRVSVEWNVGGALACRAGLDVDRADANVGWWVALAPVSLWFHVAIPQVQRVVERLAFAAPARRSVADSSHRIPWRREWSAGLMDGYVRWCLGDDPDDLSSFGDTAKQPRWKRGSFNAKDALFGRERHVHVPVAQHTVEIPLHEGAYPATVELSRLRTWRERLPRLTLRESGRAKVEIDMAKLSERSLSMPMFPGKGENSYDLDDDTFYGSSMPAENVAEAVASYVESVMTMRLRRGGRIDWQPRAPEFAVQA